MAETSKRVALVTGANKGIGLQVVQELARAGQMVLLGARNVAAGRESAEKLKAEGLTATVVELDLARPETIAAAAKMIEERFGRLDVLVNNAGIADPTDGAPSLAPLDAVERTLRTNFLGAVAVTQAMLPLVKKSKSGRIVNVSSGLGSIQLNGDPNWPYVGVKFLGYSASKAALNMLTAQLAYELRETGIKVNSADPGYTATDLNDNRGHQTVAQGAAETVRLALLGDDGPTGKFFATEGPQPW